MTRSSCERPSGGPTDVHVDTEWDLFSWSAREHTTFAAYP